MHNIELYVIVRDIFGVCGESFEGQIVLSNTSTAEVFKSRHVAESRLEELIKDLNEPYEKSTTDEGLQFYLYHGSERYYLQRLSIDNSL